MISFLGEWITHIILLIFMATFLDLLLPNSSMRRYVKLVVGLIIILVILSPILHIFQFDYERLLAAQDELLLQGDPLFVQKVEEHQQSIEDWQQKAILDEVAAVWSEEMKRELEAKFDIAVHEVQFTLLSRGEQAYVQEVALYMEERLERVEETEKDEAEGEVKPIEPVVIEVNPKRNRDEAEEDRTISNSEKKIEQEVLTYLDQEWNISVDKITCTWLRR